MEAYAVVCCCRRCGNVACVNTLERMVMISEVAPIAIVAFLVLSGTLVLWGTREGE